jgi:hypothetical protein
MAEKIEIEFIAKLEKYVSDMLNAQRKTESSASKMKESFDGVKGSISSFAGAFGIGLGVGALATFTVQSVKSAAQLEVLRSNFKGTTDDLKLFEKATAGTVTEANLIKLSNQATDLGLSVKQQAILFSLAEDAADKYGGGVEENFGRVLKASEGSTKGLKELGIQKAKYDEIVKQYVSDAGAKQLDQLDAETQKWIQVEAMIKASGVTMDDVNSKMQDSADKIESIGVKWEKFKTSTGEVVLPVLGGILDAVVSIGDWAERAGNELDRLIGLKGIFGGGTDDAKPDNTEKKTQLDAALANNTYVKNGKIVSTPIKRDVTVTTKPTKEKEVYRTDEQIKKELDHVNAIMKGNISLAERNRLLAIQVKLENELYSYQQAIDLTEAGKAANLKNKGMEIIPVKDNTRQEMQNVKAPYKPELEALLEIDDTWQEIGNTSRRATQMMASGLARAIVYGENFVDVLKNIGTMALESALSFFINAGFKALGTAMGIPPIYMANGGMINEPVVGMGIKTGTSYAFGERGPEMVMPLNKITPVESILNAIGKKENGGGIFQKIEDLINKIPNPYNAESIIGMANGGMINEPVVGMGTKTGTSYAFGERGPEMVMPLNKITPVESILNAIGKKENGGGIFQKIEDLINKIPNAYNTESIIGMANGGMINEPVVGMGLRSGTSYAFGERGVPEMVMPMDRIVPRNYGGYPSTLEVNVNMKSTGKVLGRDLHYINKVIEKSIKKRR